MMLYCLFVLTTSLSQPATRNQLQPVITSLSQQVTLNGRVSLSGPRLRGRALWDDLFPGTWLACSEQTFEQGGVQGVKAPTDKILKDSL